VFAPRKERWRRQGRGYAGSATFFAVHVCVKVKTWEKEMKDVDVRLRLEMINSSDWISGLGFDNVPPWASSVGGKKS
jgi:hypothetical protein